MPYCSQADVENAMGKNVILAIYDDDMDGVVDTVPMEACLAFGTSECDSFLRGHYDIVFPISPVPDEVKFAAVDFCVAYSARRRPDITRAMSEMSWTEFMKSANDRMKRYVEAMKRLPPSTGTPTNVGGVVRAVAGGPSMLGSDRSQMWDDMGDWSR